MCAAFIKSEGSFIQRTILIYISILSFVTFYILTAPSWPYITKIHSVAYDG
jgi:hypothetical protein